ncbi:hypothetical protein MMC11_004522 [Xylographa trunciseda]|nr:hypothetical protein [Xylographa trunciseda]
MSLEARKRKLLTDFFLPAPKGARNAAEMPSYLTTNPSESAAVSEQGVPGLSLYPDFVNKDEEINILRFLKSEQCTWRTDLSRKTMHFGGEYCLMPPRLSSTGVQKKGHTCTADATSASKPQIIQAPPMPQEFDWLLQRMTDKGLFPKGSWPQYCIVNHYTGNLGISAHTENFSFAQPVVGLSLLDSCAMRFHELVAPDGGSVRSGKAQKAQRTGRHVDVILPSRSLVVMNDDARWKWQHEIVEGVIARFTSLVENIHTEFYDLFKNTAQGQ